MSSMTIGLAAALAAVIVVTAIATTIRRRRHPRTVAAPSRNVALPQGAEAALWSIVEAVPDPRNHLALTRDLTGEVRIADGTRSLADVLLAAPAPALAPLIPRAERAATAPPAGERAGDDRFALAGSSFFSTTPLDRG